MCFIQYNKLTVRSFLSTWYCFPNTRVALLELMSKTNRSKHSWVASGLNAFKGQMRNSKCPKWFEVIFVYSKIYELIEPKTTFSNKVNKQTNTYGDGNWNNLTHFVRAHNFTRCISPSKFMCLYWSVIWIATNATFTSLFSKFKSYYLIIQFKIKDTFKVTIGSMLSSSPATV